MSRVDPSIIPPSVADLRGRAFGETVRLALDEADFRKLLFARIDAVPDDVLPFLIREFSIEEFVEPGMSAAAIRRLLRGSYELHARKGFIDGVRTGLEMLGFEVLGWEQWFQTTPKRPAGTHRVLVSMREEIIDGEGPAITQRMLRTFTRMADGMKRWSQTILPVFPAESHTPVYAGAAVASLIRIRPTVDPLSVLGARPPVFVGAVVKTHLTVRPQVPA